MMLFALIATTLVSCTEEADLATSDDNYGYVQFKLYKEASYVASKADDFTYLNQAKRMEITFGYGSTTITQTIALSAYDDFNAEYGLRSEKLLLLSGDYTVKSFKLYNVSEQQIYSSTMAEFDIVVPRGGLEVYDLTAQTDEYRGHARFIFTKEFITTRAEDNIYENFALLTSTHYAKLSLTHSTEGDVISCDSIPINIYSTYDESNNNYQSLEMESDSLFNLKVGKWNVTGYSFYSSTKSLLASGTPESSVTFDIEDNAVTEAEVPITIDVTEEGAPEYIKDYQALKAIWEALDGENWSYYGQNYAKGANWDFNKDVDLWGYQPGVMLHTNGRVASITLSEFGFSGHMPSDIGQLTQLVELYLGTHNDTNADVYASTLSGMALNGTYATARMDMAKAYVDSRIGNPIESAISPLMRQSYISAGKEVPGGLTVTQEMINNQAVGDYYTSTQKASIYQTYTPNGASSSMRADVSHGKYCNGLLSLPEEFCDLESLTTLYIANGMLKELPADMSKLTKLTDVEIYNCQDMTEFPMGLTTLPYLVALNIAENTQWSSDTIYNGLDALLSSSNVEYLQLLYCNNNTLKAIPASINNAVNLSMLMAVICEIESVPSAPNFRPVQLYLDYNSITSMPDDFCDTDDLETLSVSNNKLTVMPNFFSKDDIPSDSISFADNEIDTIPDESSFNGISTLSLDLSGNKLTAYPAVFAQTKSWINAINISNNRLAKFEDECFVGETVWYTESIDISRNYLSEIPDYMNGINLPYLYGLDISYNAFTSVPISPANSAYLTIYIVRGQRDSAGNRVLKEWPVGITSHTALVGFFIGSNDIREISDTLYPYVYLLDVSDNPNLKMDASSICPYIEAGYYNLYYDKTQDIRNCTYLGIY